MADLVVEGVEMPSEPFGIETAIRPILTVKNVGDGRAGAFVVQWKPRPDARPLPTPWGAGLSPGESKKLTLGSYTYRSGGTFEVEVSVDSLSDVDEADETNNFHRVNVQVVGDSPEPSKRDRLLAKLEGLIGERHRHVEQFNYWLHDKPGYMNVLNKLKSAIREVEDQLAALDPPT